MPAGEESRLDVVIVEVCSVRAGAIYRIEMIHMDRYGRAVKRRVKARLVLVGAKCAEQLQELEVLPRVRRTKHSTGQGKMARKTKIPRAQGDGGFMASILTSLQLANPDMGTNSVTPIGEVLPYGGVVIEAAGVLERRALLRTDHAAQRDSTVITVLPFL